MIDYPNHQFHQRSLLKQLNILITVLFSLTIVSQLQAAGELRRPFQGIRNLGMGNVGVAMSHDENALFYNPAGLAAVDTTLVNIPFQAEFSNDAQTLIREASGLAGKSTSEILTSIWERSTLKDYVPKFKCVSLLDL